MYSFVIDLAQNTNLNNNNNNEILIKGKPSIYARAWHAVWKNKNMSFRLVQYKFKKKQKTTQQQQ